MRNDCGPTDAPGIGLEIDDTSICSVPQVSGVYVFVTGDLANVQLGVPLSVSGDSNAPVQANHIVSIGGPAPAGTGGTITFTAFVKSESAAGSYDVAFSDGSTEQGDFSAVFCSGLATCG
jgi:hypothetical protein